MKLAIWRICLLLFAVFAIWRVLIMAMSAHYLDLAEAGDPEAAEKAVAWDKRNARALTIVAANILEEDPRRAEQLLRRAVRENPADARPLLLLGEMARSRDEMARADELFRLGTQLMPVKPSVLKAAAAYWVRRGDTQLAVDYWARALEADEKLREELFPVFRAIGENAGIRGLLSKLTSQPPPWWEGFFIEFSREAASIEDVRAVFNMRKESKDSPPTRKERLALVYRFQKEGLTAEAYLAWINSLNRQQTELLGLLYNGNFEQEITNAGFDWRIAKTDAFEIKRARTRGIKGEKALRLVFRGRKERFHHLRQSLFIAPGNYRLVGNLRSDGLDTAGGLRWAVYCKTGGWSLLSESEHFKRSPEWRQFTLDFTVPETCEGQTLRLESTGRRPFEHVIKGSIWFDSMSIHKLDQPVETSPEALVEESGSTDLKRQKAKIPGEKPR